MKKLFILLLAIATFAIGADVKPFVFENVESNDSAQQAEFEYMLKYKLFGRDYITIGNDVVIKDESGWNGTAGYMTANDRLKLGGPVLVADYIQFKDQPTLTSGPVRAQTYTYNNQNGACINGYVCLGDVTNSKVNHCETGMVYNSSSQICADNVPPAPTGLSIPTITWPDTISHSIIFDSQLNGDIKTIVVPDGSDQYDIYLDTIQFKLDHQKLQIEMQDGGRLTRIFVKHFLYHDHGQIQVVYRTDSTNYALSQKDYRGNVIIYTDESISIVHSDNSIMQGTMISTKEIYLACNINFAGQLLANQLRIGDTYNGENFRFVKFDPDTIDVKLDKYGGLRENDSTVVIPIELSDTTDINVYFTYCVELNDGVTIEDFNIPPSFPICNNGESKKVSIPTGSKTPDIPIQINVKVDTLTEPNDILVLKITDISGAILPNGKTDGELKIKIIDAEHSPLAFDTTAVYKFDENKIGVVDIIKVLNKSDEATFTLDSAYEGRYTLDATTGELTLIANPLDFETAEIDYIKVTVKDTGDVSITRTIPIKVNDINEAPSIKDTTITLSENLPIPSIVGTLKATDPDTKNSTFRQNVFTLLEGNSNFAIDNNGRITATKIFDYETDSTEYKLKVKVYDKTDPTLYDIATVTIKIGDTNEGPKFATEDTTFFVNENVPAGVIGIVAANDEDGDAITYSIVGSVPFTINTTTGAISSTRPFDYESETKFTFKVVAKSSGDLTDTLKVTVVVNNENEACNVNDTTFSIKENATGKIGNVNATDLDKDALFGTLHYTISDSTNYKIDKDGNVFVKNPFNYEDKTVDSIKVYVTDGTNKDSATIAVKVINVPEDITLTGTIKPIEENVEIGTLVGIITGVDGDSTAVSYTINTTDFKIDPNGVITTNSNIDYETQNEYPVTVTVKSTDGSTKDTSFTIQVINVNEPVHINDTTLTVPENYTGPIGEVEGKDDDREPVEYSVRDSINYSIDSLGVITIKNPLDYEQQKTDTLIIDVKTPSGDKDSAIVIINVKNINETPELLPNDTLTVTENCKNCVIGEIKAVDPDDDPITYKVVEPGFTIDSNGVLTITNPVDYETTPVVTITVIATDPTGAGDTATYTIKVTDVNEPVHTQDTTCSVKENYTGNVCKIPGTDDDGKKPTWIVTDTTNYSIDTTGQLVIKNPIDFEKKTKDTVMVIVTDGTFYDTAKVIINVLDELEVVDITEIDHNPPKDTIKTNTPEHNMEYTICEGNECELIKIDLNIHKDTLVKVCNEKNTSCDSVLFLFNDAPPIVTLVNATSTSANIDYITIEEEKDDKIYVNKKENQILVIVQDTVKNKIHKFEISVKLDTIPTKDIKLKEYSYILDESKAELIPIGNGKAELVEKIIENGTEITITQTIDIKTGNAIDGKQTISYTKKVNGKDVVVSYVSDCLTGKKIGNYEVSYMADSSTKVTYSIDDNKKIVKNSEGNIGYLVTYDYVDDFGNKATATVEIIFDDIPPVVEILSPITGDILKTNAIEIKWTVNGIIQDTLVLQRLEKGPNLIIRKYVDKAGNEAIDTVYVIMKEAKAIEIDVIHPVTEISKDKVDEYYSSGEKYNPKKPYKIKLVDPKSDTIPETIGIGLKVDIALPSVSPTGGLSTLDDLVKDGMIPVDENGNVVGASTIGIPVEEYVEEHCTEEFKQDFNKNGMNIPLYDIKYRLHLWVYTTTANYVNDYTIEYELNDQEVVSEAGTVKMVIDWLTDKNGAVLAENGKALGTGSYITKLYSKSIAKHRCDFKEQNAGDKVVKNEESTKIFGFKRPKNK